jgi:hypothetical protein
MKKTFLALTCLAACATVQAADVYGGIGFPGLTLGYAQAISPSLGLRGEYSGGLDVSKNGKRDGVDFEGKLKAQSVAGLVDWFPMDGGFRATGGITLNDTKFSLNSTAQNGTATINGKTVNLAGKFFNVDIKFPDVTPYLGIGYGFKPDPRKTGWGFYTDVGFMVGKFTATTTQNVVGTPTLTGTILQSDVDAQTARLRDDLGKLSVLPKFSIGVSYRF